jgi:hypothetical protein
VPDANSETTDRPGTFREGLVTAPEGNFWQPTAFSLGPGGAGCAHRSAHADAPEGSLVLRSIASPTIPSGFQPWCRWKRATAAQVAGPARPASTRTALTARLRPQYCREC